MHSAVVTVVRGRVRVAVYGAQASDREACRAALADAAGADGVAGTPRRAGSGRSHCYVGSARVPAAGLRAAQRRAADELRARGYRAEEAAGDAAEE
jgi:hypothetical protein